MTKIKTFSKNNSILSKTNFDYTTLFTDEILNVNSFFNEDVRKIQFHNKHVGNLFYYQLQNLKGNGQNSTKAVPFADLVKTSIAYFYSEIFKDEPLTSDYSIKAVKGYFDACNHTTYIPAQSIVSEYKELKDTDLFTACWLVIQTAYHYGTIFGKHQLLDYLHHYLTTGEKLPIDSYKYDVTYLNSKYVDIERDKKKKGFYQNTKSYLKHWYYSSLELILDNLGIQNLNFKQQKENEFRIYNSTAQCPRTLRYLQPFILVGFDITGAYPSFIDKAVGSNLGKTIYDNIATSTGISRSEAKTLFNRALNSKKYRSHDLEFIPLFIDKLEAQGLTDNAIDELLKVVCNDPLLLNNYDFNYNQKAGIKRELKGLQFQDVLLKAGYSPNQTNLILNEITDSKDFLFFDWASKLEETFINYFKLENYVFNSTRVHDALFVIKDTKIDYDTFNLNFQNISFECSHYGTSYDNFNFSKSKQWKQFKTCGFSPKILKGITTIHEYKKSEILGTFHDSIKVEYLDKNKELVSEVQNLNMLFYKEEFAYLSSKFKYDDVETYDDLLNNFIRGFNIMALLSGFNNKRPLTYFVIFSILKHYRKESNLCFSIETMAKDVYNNFSYNYQPTQNDYQYRDFNFNQSYPVKNEFVLMCAIKKAREKVLRKNIIDNILNTPVDSFIDVAIPKNDKGLVFLVNYLNFNRLGFQRKTKQHNELITNKLTDYNDLKSRTLSSSIKVRDINSKYSCNDLKTSSLQGRKVSAKTKAKQILNLSKAKELILHLKGDKSQDKKALKLMLKDMEQHLERIAVLMKMIKETNRLGTRTETPAIIEYDAIPINKGMIYDVIPTKEELKYSHLWSSESSKGIFRDYHKKNNTWDNVLLFINNDFKGPLFEFLKLLETIKKRKEFIHELRLQDIKKMDINQLKENITYIDHLLKAS
jgi:hypothetical protein